MAYSIRSLLNLDGAGTSSASHGSGGSNNPQSSSSSSPSGSNSGGSGSSSVLSSEDDSYVAGMQEEGVMMGEQGDSLVREADSEHQTSGRRRKRPRTSFTPRQLVLLEAAFSANSYPDTASRQDLACTLNIDEGRVMVWFQNRRARYRKNHDRCSGGRLNRHLPHQSPMMTMAQFPESYRAMLKRYIEAATAVPYPLQQPVIEAQSSPASPPETSQQSGSPSAAAAGGGAAAASGSIPELIPFLSSTPSNTPSPPGSAVQVGMMPTESAPVSMGVVVENPGSASSAPSTAETSPESDSVSDDSPPAVSVPVITTTGISPPPPPAPVVVAAAAAAAAAVQPMSPLVSPVPSPSHGFYNYATGIPVMPRTVYVPYTYPAFSPMVPMVYPPINPLAMPGFLPPVSPFTATRLPFFGAPHPMPFTPPVGTTPVNSPAGSSSSSGNSPPANGVENGVAAASATAHQPVSIIRSAFVANGDGDMNGDADSDVDVVDEEHSGETTDDAEEGDTTISATESEHEAAYDE